MNKNFIGIDFSKEKFDVTVITADGLEEQYERKYSSFSNNSAGFSKFCRWCGKNANGIDSEQWLFCGEHTGDYSIPLADYLYSRGYGIWLANAYAVKGENVLKRRKDDRLDSAMIAEYAMRNCDKADLYEPLSDTLKDIREMYLLRAALVKERTMLLVRDKEKKRTMRECNVKNTSTGICSRLIKHLDEEMELCENTIKELVSEDEQVAESYEILTSMPGVGIINATCLIVYTNNFKKFSMNPRKIASYYGVAPFGKQSGTSVHVRPHVSPFANKKLKSLLSMAALAAIIHCPVIRQYYERLIKKGKNKNLAKNNVKNKMIHILAAMIRKKEKFNPDRLYEEECSKTEVLKVC